MTREERRKKLLRHLKYNRSVGADYLITDEDVDEIIKALEQEPCDDKTGCWEWVQYDGNPNIGNWHCSECRSIVIKGVKKEKRSVIFPLYKNCPQCSAKMEVEK